MEGTYNFAVEDDEIDEGMFAGDRNSARVQEPRLRYMDPAALNHAIPASSELSEGEGIRLENYQSRVSPVSSFRNGTTAHTSVDVNGGGGGSSEPAREKNASNGRSATVPTSKQDSSENNDVDNRLNVNGNEPQLYAQADRSKKNQKANKESPDSAKNELLKNGSLYDADTSEDDSIIWPPPPPPPQASNPNDDSDWERPLPPEIMALPGKRNRVAAWADDD